MNKELNENLPIYTQIMMKISQAVVSGEMKPGERVPSVRDLAELFGVNPNTMQRALSELERDGLLASERTTGRYVTHDTNLIEITRIKLAKETVENFQSEMEALGFTTKEIASFFHNKVVERVG
ncbi:MAG: GntR family transcriptional regulator [Anaerovoracaceae bacterium]